jgi:N-hydroxyarylamine O-acetyltransferase
MDENTLTAYLRRIGAERPEEANAESLRHLQERHGLSVPFETLAFNLGEPVPHSMDAVKKIVDERRGGSCYEVHSAFALLLRALGFQVDFLFSRNYRRNGSLEEYIGHVALRVWAEDAPDTQPASARPTASHPWLVDVVHSKHSRSPLRLDLRTPQDDAHGRYVLTDAPDGDVDVLRDDEPVYRLEVRARDLNFAVPFVWWHRTAPESPFATRSFCVLSTETGQVTLAGNKFIVEEKGRRTVAHLTTEEELRETYRTWFGLRLENVSSLLPRPDGRFGPYSSVPSEAGPQRRITSRVIARMTEG